jgi:hypothetical protein
MAENGGSALYMDLPGVPTEHVMRNVAETLTKALVAYVAPIKAPRIKKTPSSKTNKKSNESE